MSTYPKRPRTVVRASRAKRREPTKAPFTLTQLLNALGVTAQEHKEAKARMRSFLQGTKVASPT